MKKISLKNFSFVGLFLLGASAVTAAIMPSKADDDSNAFAGPGSLAISTAGGAANLTVVTGSNAALSHTETGLPGIGNDQLSATSVHAAGPGTLTQEVGNRTAGVTTANA